MNALFSHFCFVRTLLICMLAVAFGHLGSAQGAEAMRGEFRLISMTRIASPLYYFDGSEYRQVRTRLNRLSEPYAFQLTEAAAGRIRFFTTEPSTAASAVEEGERFRMLGEVALNRSGDVIFLLTPVTEGVNQSEKLSHLRIAQMPDVFNRNAKEGWLFVNLSAHTIFAQVGQSGRLLRFETQSQQMIEVTDTREFDLVQFAARIDGEAQIFYSTAWPIHQGSRYIVFFSDQDDGSVVVSRIAAEVR